MQSHGRGAFTETICFTGAHSKVFSGICKQPCFPLHAKKQATALKRMFKETVFDDEEHAQLSVLVSERGFPVDLEAEMLDSIISAGGDAKRSNSKLQDVTTMLHYFSRDVWNHVQKEDETAKSILSALFTELLAFGPSKPQLPNFSFDDGVVQLSVVR